MRTTVTKDHLEQLLRKEVLLDQRSQGFGHEITGAIWIEPSTHLLHGANWELLMVPAFTRLSTDCQAAVLDAVNDLQTKYSLQATHFLGGSARA